MIRAQSTVIPGRSRSERIRNPDISTVLVSGFRVRAFSAPRNDGEKNAEDV